MHRSGRMPRRARTERTRRQRHARVKHEEAAGPVLVAALLRQVVLDAPVQRVQVLEALQADTPIGRCACPANPFTGNLDLCSATATTPLLLTSACLYADKKVLQALHAPTGRLRSCQEQRISPCCMCISID